jgi:arylsulfatase A-like enzyme
MTMDLTASILAATVTPVPSDARLEGVNLFPILERKAPQVERTVFWRTGGPSPVNMNQKAVRSGDWKLMIDGAVTRIFLFNVKADPGERQDLFARRPDIAHRPQKLLAEWERDVDAEAKAFAATRLWVSRPARFHRAWSLFQAASRMSQLRKSSSASQLPNNCQSTTCRTSRIADRTSTA